MPCPPKMELVQLYFDRMMTQCEIATHYKTTQKVVFRWFREVGIKSRVAAKRNQYGYNNDSWKGDNASYFAFHCRIRKMKGSANKCEECGRSDDGIVYDWANQTGNYANMDDYKMMCRSCHFKKDELSNNLPNRRKKILVNHSKKYNGRGL